MLSAPSTCSSRAGERLRNVSIESYNSNLKEKYDDVIDDIKKVIIFFKKEMAGGCNGEYNDCLWDCIDEMIVRTRWGIGQCEDAAAMKKYLTLPRKAKIPVARQ